jgi:septal ring factor EnvC (AmiA/AmiB activator)
VLDYWQQADDRPFLPPLNLIDVALFPLRPFSFFKPVERAVWYVVTFPFAFIIAAFETIAPPTAVPKELAATARIVSEQADDADDVETQDEDEELGRRVIERLDRMEEVQEKLGHFTEQVDRVLSGLTETARKLEEMASQRGKHVNTLDAMLARVLEKVEKLEKS